MRWDRLHCEPKHDVARICRVRGANADTVTGREELEVTATAAAATKTVNTLTANTLLAQKRGERAEDMMVATEVGLADFVRSSREAERRWISNSFSLVAATRLWCFVCLVGEDRSVDYGLWTSFMASVDQELLSSTITRVCIVCIVGSYVWILTMDAPTSHHTHVLSGGMCRCRCRSLTRIFFRYVSLAMHTSTTMHTSSYPYY